MQSILVNVYLFHYTILFNGPFIIKSAVHIAFSAKENLSVLVLTTPYET